MTEPDPWSRIAELERQVGSLWQYIDHLYRHLGIPGPLSQQSGPSGPESDPELRDALARGDKIHAIKRFRELTGVGLAQAKDAVDAMTGRS